MKYCKNCGTQLDDSAYVRADPVSAPAPTSITNTFAIVGFILAFFFPLLGLIFSIIGLNKVKECNSGRGLAIAGIVISAVIWFIEFLVVFLLIWGGLFLSAGFL